jgi:hypothetical protein
MVLKLAARGVAIGVALAACASTTKLTNVLVVPETPRAKFRKVLVVGIVKNQATRQAYEAAMVKALQGAGVQAAPSQLLLPIGAAPTREAVERLVAERGFDAAVVGRLVDARTQVQEVPPTGAGFYGFYGWAAPIAYSPGYLETTQTVVVETRAFRTAGDGAAVFSATSESIDPSSAKDASQSISKLVVDELRKNGFV